MSLGVLIAVVFLLAVVAFVWLTYNRLVAKRLATDNSWSQIDVALRRRHDLIPDLVESVRGYASHERTTFEHVSEARSAARRGRRARPDAPLPKATLGRAVDGLLVVAEAYPQLEASDNFAELQRELAETEDQIADHPSCLQRHGRDLQHRDPGLPRCDRRASLRLRRRRDFFDAPAEAEQAPAVSLGTRKRRR